MSFKSSLENGKDVLYLGCSSALSGSINIAHTVAKELMEEYPGRKVICVDTLRATFAEGILAIKSAMLREEGYSIEENADWINEHKLESNLVCTVETLSYLKNAGRVKATTAFFGNILGVKPMLIEDALGNNFAVKKIKGRRASLLELINMMKETIVDPENQVIYLEHADSEIDCDFVKEHIIDAFNPKEVYVSYVGPIIGSTTGPGTIIVSYFGKKVEIKGE
jgi:DegV family protein with EDD domain